MKLSNANVQNKTLNPRKGAVLIITTLTLTLCTFVCALLSIFAINGYKVSIGTTKMVYDKIELENRLNEAYGACIEFRKHNADTHSTFNITYSYDGTQYKEQAVIWNNSTNKYVYSAESTYYVGTLIMSGTIDSKIITIASK